MHSAARKNPNLKPVELYELVTCNLAEQDSPLIPLFCTFKQEAIEVISKLKGSKNEPGTKNTGN